MPVDTRTYEMSKSCEVPFPPGLSLECCEGDQNAEHIEFTHDQLSKISDFDIVHLLTIESKPFPLYHAHVLWGLIRRWRLLEDGTFSYALVDIGSHITAWHEDELRNHPEGLIQPDILAATFTFIDAKGDEMDSFEFSPADLTSTKRFTRDELGGYAADGNFHVRVRIIIARAYFSLSKLLKKPPVPEGRADLVARILRGERPADSDCVITFASGGGGDGGLPLTYYAHSAVLAGACNGIKDVFSCAKPPYHYTMPLLVPEDMPVFISFVYGIDAPLPSLPDSIGRLVRGFDKLFATTAKDDIVKRKLFPQWERAICERALALDKHDAASYPILVRLLKIIWCCSYGCFPVAKRVAIGVLADQAWLMDVHEANNNDDFTDKMFNAQLAFGLRFGSITDVIFQSMRHHVNKVSSVRKIGLATKKKDEQPTTVPTAARDLDAPPTAVPIEDFENQVESEENGEQTKWQCAIS